MTGKGLLGKLSYTWLHGQVLLCELYGLSGLVDLYQASPQAEVGRKRDPLGIYHLTIHMKANCRALPRLKPRGVRDTNSGAGALILRQQAMS